MEDDNAQTQTQCRRDCTCNKTVSPARGFPWVKSQPFKYVGKHIMSHYSPIFEVWDTCIIKYVQMYLYHAAQYLVLN